MDITYCDSAEELTISRKRAIRELKDHGVTDPSEFFGECGYCEDYNAQEVLQWLGY